MTLINFLVIFIGVLLNAVAQLLLKAGTNSLGTLTSEGAGFIGGLGRVIFEIHILSGLICYVFSVAIWIIALSKVPVSVAYPMLSIGYVVNSLAAWYLFGEIVTMQKTFGILFILAGVFLVAKS